MIIPAHNEDATIGEIAGRAASFGTVFVMDDCSTDRTAAVAGAAGATVITNATNLGYDRNIDRGLAEADRAGFEAAVTIDADGEHDPELLQIFRRHLMDDGIPLVLGVRSKRARISEMIMGLVIQNRFGVTDILCGMKGYRLELFRENGGFDHCSSIGTELAIASIRRGHPFVEVPITGRPRLDRPRFGNSPRANLKIFRALWQVMTRPLETGISAQ